MKKVLIILLATTLLLSFFTSGCRDSQNSSETSSGDVTTPDISDTSDPVSNGTSDSAPDNADTPIKLLKKPADIKENDFSEYGLQVNSDGVITLNGKPYYGMGVNFHPAFHLALDKVFYNDTHTDLEAHFKTLSKSGIPVLRINFNIFYGNQVFHWNDSDKKDKWFGAMDYIVSLAEKYNIGIIASLFWNINTFLDYTGETMDMITVPDSASTKLRMKYVKEVVGRYKYSPAIWAWEIGNELNLAVDLQQTKFIASDGTERIFSSDMLTAYYKLIGDAIREEDPYRMITGGDAAPRTSSMALYRTQGASWSPKNDYNGNKQAFEWYTPSPLNTVSIHYPELSLMKDYVKAAKELKIGLYIGEFHGTLFENPGDKTNPEENTEEALEQSSWYEMRDTYIDLGVQLVTYWCYGSYTQNRTKDPASLELGVLDGYTNNYYVCEGIREANERYLAEGKADTPAYWGNVTNALFQ